MASLDFAFAFVFHEKWHLLPQGAVERAAVEGGSLAYIDPLNYAQGVALSLGASEKHG
jgi:hypothetical protein